MQQPQKVARNQNGVVLKADTRGRVLTTLARRESLLDEFEQSGLSGAKFAQLAGLKYSTFACWLQRRRRERGALASPGKKVPAAQVNWLEAVTPPRARSRATPDLSSTLTEARRIVAPLYDALNEPGKKDVAALLAQAAHSDYRSYHTNEDFLTRDQLADVFKKLGITVPDLRWEIMDMPDKSVELHPTLKSFINDVDLHGTTLDSYAKNLITDVVSLGRAEAEIFRLKSWDESD